MTPKKATSRISLADPIDNYYQPLPHWQPHCRIAEHPAPAPDRHRRTRTSRRSRSGKGTRRVAGGG